MTELKVFKGLSVIARVIGDEILESITNTESDIVVEHRLIPEITPELSSLGLSRITIYARRDVLSNFTRYREEFHEQIRSVFGTLQRPRWGNVLFPELFNHIEQKEHNPEALLFPYHQHFESDDIDYYFLVERDIKLKFLRITIESETNSRLNLDVIKHKIVNDLGRRAYLQGLTRISESFYQGILRECENFRNEHTENNKRLPHFFSQISHAGLSDGRSVVLRWPLDKVEFLLNEPHSQITEFIKKTFLLLEDRDMVSRLKAGFTIEMSSEGNQVFLDLSQLGHCLNISLFQERTRKSLRDYLHRMPALEEVSLNNENIFQGVRIFLVHHITAEILATLKALEKMGAAGIRTLFVKYAGIIPGEYLETLLSQSAEYFDFHALQKIETPDNPGGYYTLSRQFSSNEDLQPLDNLLKQRKLGYYEAMQLAAGYFFLQEAVEAHSKGERIFLIEDGGYLAPLINQFSLEKKTLREVFDYFALQPDDSLSKELLNKAAGDWLGRLMPGSIEHTRNGYDRLLQVQQEYGTLFFPACSIAISNMKRNLESREVAVSILHAIESILHGLGRVLSNRRPMILGSRGAIGKNLLYCLRDRSGRENIMGVDLVQEANPEDEGIHTVQKLEDISDELLYETDLFLGVIGKSIMNREVLTRIVLNSNRKSIFFASGSTKTAEFTELSGWLYELEKQDQFQLGDAQGVLEINPFRDPQTELIQGKLARFVLQKNGQEIIREFYLLGDLTPINFLYYGVPTETMDAILAQLIEISAGLVRRSGELPPRLLAVDHEITPAVEDLTVKK